MVLGLSINWDNHVSICSSYEGKLSNQDLYSSKKVVEHEAAHIIRGNRTSLYQFIEIHSRDDFGGFKDLKQKLREFEEDSSSLIDYVDYREDKFEDFIQGSTDSIDLLQVIDSDFEKPTTFIQKIKSGNSFINYLEYTPSRHLTRYSSSYNRLASRIKNEDDLEVLLDSHHFTQEQDMEVAFLSMDKKDIIRNQDKIEKVLPKVSVFNPANHV